ARHERRPPRRLAAARTAPPQRPLRPGDPLRRRRPGPGCPVRTSLREPRPGARPCFGTVRTSWQKLVGLAHRRPDVDHGFVLDRYEGRADLHDQGLDLVEDATAVVVGLDDDPELVLRLRLEP